MISRAFPIPHRCLGWCALLLAGCLVIPLRSRAETTGPAPFPADFQERLVQLFSDDRCGEVVRLVDRNRLRFLRPTVMAIVAYCEPPWESPEEIFALAESLSPTGDLILTLHAKYRWKKDPKSSEILWQKLRIVARNPVFRQMGNDYLSGVVEEDKPLNLSPTSLYGTFLIGTTSESDPRPPDFIFLRDHPSQGLEINPELTWRHFYPFGSLAVNYSGDYNRYFAEKDYDRLDQKLEAKVAFNIASNKDFVFAPFIGYGTVGSEPYRSKVGLALEGVVYHPDYKQSVSGIVYSNNVYRHELAALDSANYRFEYNWGFFPPFWSISALLWIEHVSADHTGVFNGVSGYFPFSYTSVGTAWGFRHNFKTFSVGIAPRLIYRLDSEDSFYPSRSTGMMIDERRADWTIGVSPSVHIPIFPGAQLQAWYEYNQIISDMGPDSYANRNQINHVFGLAIKSWLSTY